MGVPSEDRTENLAPTQAEPAAAASRASRPALTTAAATLITSEQALASVEATRVRGLMTGIAGSAAVTALIVWLLGGDPLAVEIHASALAASAVLAGACALYMRKRHAPRLALYVIIAQILVLVSGYYFWGVFSAYGALVPLSIYIASGSATRTELIVGVALCVVAQSGFTIATIFGVVDSRGLVEPNPARAGIATQLVATALLQMIAIGAAIAGRAARRDAHKILEDHNRALHEIARRDALLAEAVADANAAREAGAGGVGRFTDQTIDGYKLGEVLGRGAMGEVYAADRGDDTPLAIKLLAPHLLRDPAARERFVREQEIVATLDSPHCVRVHAISAATAALPYIVMERLEGTDLAQLLKQQSPRPLDEVRAMVTQLARGLDAAHKAGVIHRDLKPSNIFATDGPAGRTWKIVDFGASKWRDGEGTLTRDNIVGTPGYMSPEQSLGRALDPRSDVYALGLILYRVLVGVPAVVPGEPAAMLHEVAYRMPIQPSQRVTTITPQLEAVLAVALAKSPIHRFATAGEVATSFEAAARGSLDRGITQRAAVVLAYLPWGNWRR